jgi:hypothetical protein
VTRDIRIALVLALTMPAWPQIPQSAPATIPPDSSIYYQSSSGWVLLRARLFFPFLDGGRVKQFLGFGPHEAAVEIPGATADFRITEPRPTFSVRGLSPSTGLYLVRSRQRRDYRELRMPVTGDISRWTYFRASALTDLDVEPLAPGVVRVRPRADLRPGEYVLVSDIASAYRAYHVAASFGIGK